MNRTYPDINRREGGLFTRSEARSEDDGVVTALLRGRTTQPQVEEMTSLPTSNIRIGSRAGFTLVEVLMSVFILSFLFAGILAVLNVANISWNIDSGLLDLQQNVRQGMDGMIRELRQTESANVNITDGGARVDFFIPNISNRISYYLLNNQIIRQHPVNITKVIANNINNLTFCCLGAVDCFDCSAGNLQINIQASKTVKNRVLLFNLAEKVKLRN